MSSTTSRAAFYKPAGGEDVNVTTDLNNNLDKLDTNLNFRVVANATARNAISPFWAGLNVRETDTGKMYVSNGSAPISGSWDLLHSDSTVHTADNITVAATGTVGVNLKVGADSVNRYQVRGDGQVSWGAGSASAVDTNLYRSTANTLKTDDNLIVDLNHTVNGNTSLGGTLAVVGNTTLSGDLAVAGIGQVQYSANTVNQSFTSNTTLANLTNLSASVAANAVYVFNATIFVSGAANAAGDVKFTVTLPSGAVFDFAGNGPDVSLASLTVQTGDWVARTNLSSAGNTLAYGVSTSTIAITLFGRVVMSSTAGTFQLQAAQNGTSASATTIQARSHLVVTRVA